MFALLFETVLMIKRSQFGIAGLLIIFCLLPNSFGWHIGMRMNIITLSVAVFALLSVKVFKNVFFDRKVNRIIILYALYVVVSSMIGCMFSKYDGDYFRNIIAFLVGYIIVFIFINRMKLDARDYNVIIWSTTLLVLVFGTYGILNYITKINPYITFVSYITESFDMSEVFQEEERGFLQGRVSSTFIHPLLLGQVSTVILAYGIYAFKDKIPKVLYILVVVLLILMCVLCGSRSAIIPIVFIICLYLYKRGVGHIVKYSILVMGIIVFLYTYLPSDSQKALQGFFFFWDDSYAKEANIRGSSLDMRIRQFEGGVRVVEDSPVLGFGQGYVSQHGHDHPEMKGYESFIFQLLVDGGYLGIIAFLSFFFSLYYIALKKCKNTNDTIKVHSLCMSYFINILFTGIQGGSFIIYSIFFCLLNNSLLDSRCRQECKF